jgi:ribosomal protein S6
LRTYDATLIFPNSVREAALDKALEKVREEITKLNGRVVDTRPMGERLFARPLHKHDSGQYAKIRFELDPAQIEHLNARYKLNEEIFRVQIVRLEPKQLVPAPVVAPAENAPEGSANG